jgi:hypothetical protein
LSKALYTSSEFSSSPFLRLACGQCYKSFVSGGLYYKHILTIVSDDRK